MPSVITDLDKAIQYFADPETVRSTQKYHCALNLLKNRMTAQNASCDNAKQTLLVELDAISARLTGGSYAPGTRPLLQVVADLRGYVNNLTDRDINPPNDPPGLHV